MREIILVPTAHVSRKSIAHVRKIIEEKKPDAIAVELCPGRYRALRMGGRPDYWKMLRHLQFLAIVLSLLQQHFSKKFGVMAGSDMLAAARLSDEKKLPLALIDRDFLITFNRMKQVPFTEKIRLLLPGRLGVTSIDDMTQMENIPKLLSILKRRAPKIYSILVTERDKYMANQLLRLPFRRIVAVVGAGHAPGIMAHVKKCTALHQTK